MKNKEKIIYRKNDAEMLTISSTDVGWDQKPVPKIQTSPIIKRKRYQPPFLKFDGEPIAKRTRSGCIYGYLNVLQQ